jgi:hypothetical protein
MIKTLEKKIVPFVNKYATIVIKDMKDMQNAATVLSRLNQYNDKLEEERLKVTTPLNEALKAARALFKPLETKLETSIAFIRMAMSTYQTEANRLAKVEEEKIAVRVAPGKGNLSFDTASRKIEAIDRPEGKVSTDEGSVQFITRKKFEVVDIALLPKEYIVSNDVAIRKAMLEGKELPGVRYYEVQEPRNMR